eukprot:10281868-Karenia_brevis.AAC.1
MKLPLPNIHFVNDHEAPVVSTLDDLFAFPQEAFKICSKVFGASDQTTNEAIASIMGGTTFSSCFSGVDTPGTADCMATCQLSELLQRRIGHMRHLSAVEYFPPSQKELLAHPNPPCCLFTDMESFWHPSIRDKLKDMKRRGLTMSFRSLLPIIKQTGACKHRAYCMVHDRQCPVGRAKINRSGLPCINFSPF